jgi:hypothetical protein
VLEADAEAEVEVGLGLVPADTGEARRDEQGGAQGTGHPVHVFPLDVMHSW